MEDTLSYLSTQIGEAMAGVPRSRCVLIARHGYLAPIRRATQLVREIRTQARYPGLSSLQDKPLTVNAIQQRVEVGNGAPRPHDAVLALHTDRLEY